MTTFWRKFSSAVVMSLLLTGALLGGITGIVSGQTDAALVADEFDGDALRDVWRVFDPFAATGPPEAQATVTVADGYARLSVPAGTSHDLWANSNLAPRILQPAPNSNFGFEIKFDSIPTQRHQLQGLIAHVDEDTFLRLGTYHTGDELRVFAGYIAGGSGDVYVNDPISSSGSTIHLRVTRIDNNWVYSYSFDGDTWTEAMNEAIMINVTEVGFYAGNHNPSPAYTANADYFRVLDVASGGGLAVPDAPADLTTSLNGVDVTLNWAASPGAEAYSVERTLDNSTWEELGTPTDPTFTDITIACEQAASYRVRAVGSSSSLISGYSDTVSVVTSECGPPPPAPTNLRATLTDSTAVLDWDGESASYLVERSADGGSTWDRITVVEIATSHTDSRLGCDTEYRYRLQARGVDGQLSEYSGEASVQTGECTGSNTPLSDTFAPDTAPQDFWRFYDPYVALGNVDGLVELRMSGSNAEFIIPGLTSHDLWTSSSNRAPRLLQPVEDADFGYELKFETLPEQRIQMQGTIVQADDDTFLRMGMYYTGSGLNVIAAHIDGRDGNVFVNEELPAGLTPPVYLRVERFGDDWTYSYSFDNSDWTVAAEFNQPMAVTEVGFYGGNHDPAPSYFASVDYFINLNNPLVDNDEMVPPPPPPPSPPEIAVWYTDDDGAMHFGRLGNPQRFLNFMGNIVDEDGLEELYYTVDGGDPQPFRLGQDRRLVKFGDFNIEVDRTTLNPGTHELTITAVDVFGTETEQVVPFTYSDANAWPLPYEIDWASVTAIQDVAAVVDGNWILDTEQGGVRMDEWGYDRLIAIGDETWDIDYEATMEFTIYEAYSDIGIGIATGWQGHEGDESPRIEWPLEAIGWLRLFPDTPEVHIVTYPGDILATAPKPGLDFGQTYIIKVRTESVSAQNSRFSARIWTPGEPEPEAWDVSVEVPTRRGSALLIVHRTRMMVGDVTITPLNTLATPAEFSASTASDTEIEITWSAVPEATGYAIERSIDQETWELAGMVEGGETTSYIDSGLPCDSLFHYRMQAYRADDSRYSQYTRVTEEDTATCPALIPPEDLVIMDVASRSIEMSWVDNAATETEYRIERIAPGGRWTEVGAVAANSTAYDDRMFTCDTTYSYRVRAFRIRDEAFSEYSNEVEVTAPCE
jgi:regulation of enolase protein 1 (concanavalin A-like superfamily)